MIGHKGTKTDVFDHEGQREGVALRTGVGDLGGDRRNFDGSFPHKAEP